jgi:hypothetical protein
MTPDAHSWEEVGRVAVLAARDDAAVCVRTDDPDLLAELTGRSPDGAGSNPRAAPRDDPRPADLHGAQTRRRASSGSNSQIVTTSIPAFTY